MSNSVSSIAPHHRLYPKNNKDKSLRWEISCPRPPETSTNAVLDAIGELDGGIHYAKSKGVKR